jgi:hypothetical protein
MNYLLKYHLIFINKIRRKFKKENLTEIKRGSKKNQYQNFNNLT